MDRFSKSPTENRTFADSSADSRLFRSVSSSLRDRQSDLTTAAAPRRRASGSGSGAVRVSALRSNQRLRGVLKQSDSFNRQLFSYIDEYDLRGVKPGQQVEINLKSNRFDAYLELRDTRSRRLLLYGEDTDIFNTDARLVFKAKPGVRYRVRVSVSPDPVEGSQDGGRYSLQSQVIPPVPGFDFFSGKGLLNTQAAVALAAGSQSASGAAPASSPNWGINAIGANAPSIGNLNGQGVVVAVLDTGVDYLHPDLVQNLWQNPKEIPNNGFDDDFNGFIDDVIGWNFVSNNNDPDDFDGHGTAVAGIIAASSSARSPGVASGAKIMPVRVVSESEESVDSNAVAAGIRYAIQNGAQVINMSLSSNADNTLFLSLPTNIAALREAQQAGVTVVIAAGNDREDFGAVRPLEPAYTALQGLSIAVGAVDQSLKTADFSNPAGNLPMPFIVAPGVGILSTDNLGGYRSDNDGTSFSTPFVAGTVARMLQANPSLTPAQVAAILTATATRQGLTSYP